MEKQLIIIFIYLIGCVLAYIYLKYNSTHNPEDKNWTKVDRALALGLSLFSWITVVANAIVHYTDVAKNRKDPASW